MNVVNWWEIGDSQNLHLPDQELDFLKTKIEEKFGSLLMLGRKLNMENALYSKFHYKNQGITVNLLKRVLDELELVYSEIGNGQIKIGSYKLTTFNFPMTLEPEWGQVLSHSFFDGYCDNNIFRYSNYDIGVRKEFSNIVTKLLNDIKINMPDNYLRDIDLPAPIPRFLKNVFNIDTFYSDKCRISDRFFNIVSQNKLFGWYFLKGAFIDEGTITGNQIFIVRGIKNEGLVNDVQKLANLLSLSTKIRTVKPGYYTLRVSKDSYNLFYDNINLLFINKIEKWDRVSKKLEKFNNMLLKEEKVKQDCLKIINSLSKNRFIGIKHIQALCNLPPSTAFFRANLLVYNGNLSKKLENGRAVYYLKNNNISKLKTTNEMREKFGWR